MTRDGRLSSPDRSGWRDVLGDGQEAPGPIVPHVQTVSDCDTVRESSSGVEKTGVVAEESRMEDWYQCRD